MVVRPKQSNLVPELNVAQAARILDVDRRTVKRLIAQGVLRARVSGLPTSKRPRYRIPETDVLGLRNTYDRAGDSETGQRWRKVTNRTSTNDLRHIQLDG